MFDADFDGHKLALHPREVAGWLERGRTDAPLYTELELTTRCNHGCVFCGVEHIVNRRDDVIDTALARDALDQLARLGNRAVMFSGHGEPLLHPDAVAIIRHGAAVTSASLTTNGSRLDAARVELIDGLRWMRFSVNGYDSRSYAAVHGATAGTFDQVMANIEGAVRRKRDRGLEVTLGTQLVLIDENAAGVVGLARTLKRLGVDYFSVKPWSRHPMNDRSLEVDYERYLGLAEPLRALGDETFKVSFRAGAMASVGRPKAYGRCHGTHFLGYVSASGEVWECNVFADDPRFRLGSLAEESLADIWSGPRRAEVLRFIRDELDLRECRDVCRMEACNRYLWRLRHPWAHDDFI